MTTRPPTQQESNRWDSFFNRLTQRTLKQTKGCLGLGEGAAKMRVFIEGTLKVTVPWPIDNDDVSVLKDIQARAALMNRLADKVLLKTYAVSFQNGTLDIVAPPGIDKEAVMDDIYPAEGLQLGIAPIIVVAGIAAVTLLIAGDQAADRLETQAKVEALKLQRQMVETDQAMATADPAVKASYEKWKAQNAAMFGKAMANLSADSKSTGWVERFLGSGPTMALIIGALLLGGAVAFSKKKGGD
jgi:hypothetical protein